jgi:phospholipase A-2-activating protein
LIVAEATLYLNYAVLLTQSAPTGADQAITLLERLTSIISTSTDSETVFRSLIAAGTLLFVFKKAEEVRGAAEVYGLKQALERVEGQLREPKFKSLVAEIRVLL